MVPVSMGHKQVPGTVSAIIVETDTGAIKVQFDAVLSGDLNHRRPRAKGGILSLTMDGHISFVTHFALDDELAFPDDLHSFVSLFHVSRDRLVDERECESCKQSANVGPVGDIGI